MVTSRSTTRSRRRWSISLAVLLVFGVLAGCDMGASDIFVNVSYDGVDASPGNGVCEVTTGTGDCTLRAAIGEANALAEYQKIEINAGIDPVLSFAGSGGTTTPRATSTSHPTSRSAGTAPPSARRDWIGCSTCSATPKPPSATRW
jgi:hypothetical protein